ncbi:hypothetical protein B0H11DRAFT_2027721 [Mycena galericulata]|nr:hypothetical protein B0H11DRAFT_2035056 [Mycena galericulata]KAJ7477733.1 hypothetical protein B0H11DRAFT_2029230 [Mycena galericulata]KAJ7478850.1 hypothetical protein B0H11DRAFT_2027721 [Mycena galericulata]
MARCSFSPFSFHSMIWLVPMALLAVMQLSGGLCRGAPGETMHVRTQCTLCNRSSRRPRGPEATSCIDSFLCPCFCSASTLRCPTRHSQR